jgi:hypothetical protein
MTVTNRKVDIKEFNHIMNIEKFDSANELVKTCLERKYRSEFGTDTLNGDRDGDKSWTGCKDIKTALDLLSNGWSENVAKLTSKMNGVTQKVDGKRITFRNDVVGFNPIVPLAIMGVPESMLNSKMKPIKTKVIDVYYDTTVSCGNSPEQIMANGMKVMETVINLEQSGYRVRLSAMQGYTDRNSSDILIVGVKSEYQPLDIKRIMFPLMHPAMFRLVGFGWYERCPTSKYRGGYGHGFAYDFNESQMDSIVKAAFGKTAIYISGKFIQDKSQEHIERQLKGESSNDKSQTKKR